MFTRSLVLLGSLAFLAAPVAAQVERGPRATTVGGEAGTGRGAQRASCVLQLDMDPNRGGARLIEPQTLNAMLTSTALVDPAAQKVLGLSPTDWPKVAQVELVPAGNTAVRLGVTITSNPNFKVPDNAAELFLNELAARAKESVDQIGARQEHAHAERRAALEKEQAAARARLDAIQAKLRDAQATAGNADGDTRWNPSGRPLLVERQTLETNLAAQRARLRVIEEELARTSAAGGGSGGASRPVSTPWMELIAAREKVLKALETKHNAGLVEDSAVLAAEAELAEARAMAAAATANPTGAPGGFGSSQRWQDEIITLRASIAENEVRLASVVARIPKSATTQPAETAEDLNRLRMDEQRARQELDQITNQLEQLRRERLTGAAAPRLLILDGRPKQ